MKHTDYAYLPDKLIRNMEEQGETLNEKQCMILVGWLAGIQQLIEAFSLRETIDTLKATDDKEHTQ